MRRVVVFKLIRKGRKLKEHSIREVQQPGDLPAGLCVKQSRIRFP